MTFSQMMIPTMSTTPTRSNARTPRDPQFRLTPRDRAIVRDVYRCRALTAAQIERLHWTTCSSGPSDGQEGATNTRCLHRLKLLSTAHFLYRADIHLLTEGRRPYVYFLDKRGAELLVATDEVAPEELQWNEWQRDRTSLFLVHLLATNDIRIAVEQACRRQNVAVEQWIDEFTLKRDHHGETVAIAGPRGGTQTVTVIPDSYFVLTTAQARHHQFMEVDMATETGIASSGRPDWGRKIDAYQAYYRSGKYQARYHTASLRVLTITVGEKRLAHLKQITEERGGKSRYWFTTFQRAITADILTAPIWQKAASDGLFSLL